MRALLAGARSAGAVRPAVQRSTRRAVCAAPQPREPRATPRTRAAVRSLNARVVEAEARVFKAEAEALVAKAHATTVEAEARVTTVQAEARAATAEAHAAAAEAHAAAAEAAARAATAEAEARAAKVVAEAKETVLITKLASERSARASERSHALSLLHKRNLRGAVEYVCSSALKDALVAVGKPAPKGSGVQKLLSAAAQHDPGLRAVVSLLAARHGLRELDVLECLDNLYHSLSKDFHGTGDEVVVREVDWRADAERLALCAVLETYVTSYSYFDATGEQLEPSPYALSPDDLVALPRSGGGA